MQVYQFNAELKSQLLNSKTITQLSKELEISRSYLTMILNGKYTITKLMAFYIVYKEKNIG